MCAHTVYDLICPHTCTHSQYHGLNLTATIGFNVESVEYKNIQMTSWDVGGRCNLVSISTFFLFCI